MRADGIGFQSLFRGLLDSDDIASAFRYASITSGARVSLKPILQPKVAQSLISIDPSAPETVARGEPEALTRRRRFRHFDMSAGIIGEREPCGRVGGLSFDQPVDRSLVLVERLAVNRAYYACPWHLCAKI